MYLKMNNMNSTYRLNHDNQHFTGTEYTAELLSAHSGVPVTLLSSSLSAGGALQSEAKPSRTPSKKDELLTTATQFFEQQDVTQFYTMTFARRVSVEKARNRFMEWIDGLEWFQRRPLGWLRAEETKRWSGLGTPAVPLHFHGLLISAPHLNILQAEALARELAGDTQVLPYRSGGGAIRYSLKNAFHECGDYDIGGIKAFRPFIPQSER